VHVKDVEEESAKRLSVVEDEYGYVSVLGAHLDRPAEALPDRCRWL
jgi:hypothetical protein